jgi:hypothetical protein
MADEQRPYPARLTIEYPDRELGWTSTLFRPFLIVPILIILGLLIGVDWNGDGAGSRGYHYLTATLVFLPLVLMILFREKYPRWWFDWNLALTGFVYRVAAYFLLLRDEYPSTEEEQAVHIELDYPNVPVDLNRYLAPLKWFMALPHYLILWVLLLSAWLAAIAAWFAILFNGRYPRELFDFVVGVLRWTLRVQAYALLLVTDRYPPFRLSE